MIERIKSAAIVWEQQVYLGFCHADAWDFSPVGWDECWKPEYRKCEGFVTTHGRFVSREEALVIAQAVEQVGDTGYSKLFSEDLQLTEA
jgi:hypothetical protein